MTRLPACTSKAAIRALECAGFFVHHTTGSRSILKHPDRPTVRVVVPIHVGDLKRGTLNSIIKDAGLSRDEFVKLL